VRREKRGDGREWWNMRGQFRKTLPSTRRTQVWKRRCVLSGDTVRQTLSFVTKLSRLDVYEDKADGGSQNVDFKSEDRNAPARLDDCAAGYYY